MRVSISFPEIQEQIKNKTGKNIVLRKEDNKTVSIKYAIGLKIPIIGNIKRDISLHISLNEIIGTDIHMSYNCGIGIGMIISGAMKILQEDSALNFVEVDDNKQIILRLGEIDNIKSVFDKIEIQSITVSETGILAECLLKEIL